MFYWGISSNTSPPPHPQAEELSRRCSAGRYQLNWQKCHSANFACWMLVAITIVGIKRKNTANWLEDIWLSFLLTVVLIFFIFLAVHTSATRSGGKTRLGYHWLGRRASSGGCQMKVLRNRDNQRTHQGKGSGQLDRLSSVRVQHIYIVFCIDHYIYI